MLGNFLWDSRPGCPLSQLLDRPEAHPTRIFPDWTGLAFELFGDSGHRFDHIVTAIKG
jgi:hypothetical protein